MGIFQLPCDRMLKGLMSKRSNIINEQVLLNNSRKYESLKEEKKKAGLLCPVGEGVLMRLR